MHNSTRAPLLLVLFASVASAQTRRPMEEAPPPINDPAPRSPIDGGRRTKTAEQIAREQQVKEVTPPIPARAPGVIWLGWTFGSGYGWHGAADLEGATTEFNRVEAAGGSGYLGQFGFEGGWQHSERLSFVLQTRHQVIPHKIASPNEPASAPQWAHAVLAKALYSFPRSGYQLYAGGALGGGQGFRFRIDAQPSQKVYNSTTVVSGPVLVGPVAGIIYPAWERLSFVGEIRALAGIPHVGAMVDFNIGFQFDAFNK